MKIQIILTSGVVIHITTAAENFNFQFFITEVIRDRRLVMQNMFVPYESIGCISMGDVVVEVPHGRLN